MFGTARKRATHLSAGCWRHTAVVGDAACDRCGVRCCDHCWVEVPQGAYCIECALEFSGVRAPRKRVDLRDAAEVAPAPLSTLTWERSAGLIDLAPAYRNRRLGPASVAEPSFFRRAA